MRLGIDFGTTRVVVAADGGNYPLVDFARRTARCASGSRRRWPSHGGELLRLSRRAVQGQRDWTVLRSLKRLLKASGPATRLDLAGGQAPVIELATGLFTALSRKLRACSTLSPGRSETFDVIIGVPANANSNQWFLTGEAFRAAGFQVLGMLNERSAARVG